MNRHHRRPIAALGVLACLALLFLLAEEDVLDDDSRHRPASPQVWSLRRQLELEGQQEVLVDEDHHGEEDEVVTTSTVVVEDDYHESDLVAANNNFTVCGRQTTSVSNILTPSIVQNFAASSISCHSQFQPDKPTLLLIGPQEWGQTGNQLRSFVNAVQFARDYNMQLAIMMDSWAMEILLPFFFATTDSEEEEEGNVVDNVDDGNGNYDWQSRMEKALCIKIFHEREETRGWSALTMRTQKMWFKFKSTRSTPEEYVANHVHLLRTLFRYHNKGGPNNRLALLPAASTSSGHDKNNVIGDRGGLSNVIGDMCSGIDSLLHKQKLSRNSTMIYSAIHLRSHERKLMQMAADGSGCDPKGSLEMRPEYVKSILKPLGMLNHPIVVITDGSKNSYMVVSRLKTDPEIGPMIRSVPFRQRWVGGDMTLAVMADAFIGNPASTLSLFVAESRKALGFDNSYLYRARDKDSGKWYDVCGDECLFGLRKKATMDGPLRTIDWERMYPARKVAIKR